MVVRKTDLAQQVAEQTGLSRPEANRAVDAVLASISAALQKEDRVQLTGFGSFQVTHTKERAGRNPKTKKPLTIAPGKRARFVPGSKLKQAVNGK